MAAPQVVIMVSGGLVQDVFCSDESTRVLLVSWDAELCGPGDGGVVAVPVGECTLNAIVAQSSSTPCTSWPAAKSRRRSKRPSRKAR